MAMCRACGTYFDDETRLTENLQGYADIYFHLTSIRLAPDEDPDQQRICQNCHLKLLEYNSFRSVCQQVHYNRLAEIKTEMNIEETELKDNVFNDDEEDGKKDEITRVKEEAYDQEYDSVELLSQWEATSWTGEQQLAELKFQCQICNKKLSNSIRLKQHIMRHEGVKNHVCPYCGVKKTTLDELKAHVNYHTKEKEFPCDGCTKVFYSAGNRDRHTKLVHHGIKAFNCSYCDRSFGRKDHLKDHVMTHTGEKPYECKVCGRCFARSSDVKRHMMRKTHQKLEMKQRNRKSGQT